MCVALRNSRRSFSRQEYAQKLNFQIDANLNDSGGTPWAQMTLTSDHGNLTDDCGTGLQPMVSGEQLAGARFWREFVRSAGGGAELVVAL